MYTSHGHHIPGTPADPIPPVKARCGGPKLCAPCAQEAAIYAPSDNFETVIHPGAIPNVTVPLVIYDGAERMQIGTAKVRPDLQQPGVIAISAEITDPEMLKHLQISSIQGIIPNRMR